MIIGTGNPQTFSEVKTNHKNKKTMKELYENTKKKIQDIKESGFNIVYIWERDWINFKTAGNLKC
mgnify:CR=1 FL=1